MRASCAFSAETRLCEEINRHVRCQRLLGSSDAKSWTRSRQRVVIFRYIFAAAHLSSGKACWGNVSNRKALTLQPRSCVTVQPLPPGLRAPTCTAGLQKGSFVNRRFQCPDTSERVGERGEGTWWGEAGGKCRTRLDTRLDSFKGGGRGCHSCFEPGNQQAHRGRGPKPRGWRKARGTVRTDVCASELAARVFLAGTRVAGGGCWHCGLI